MQQVANHKGLKKKKPKLNPNPNANTTRVLLKY